MKLKDRIGLQRLFRLEIGEAHTIQRGNRTVARHQRHHTGHRAAIDKRLHAFRNAREPFPIETGLCRIFHHNRSSGRSESAPRDQREQQYAHCGHSILHGYTLEHMLRTFAGLLVVALVIRLYSDKKCKRPKITGVAHVAYYVKDVDKARTFYKDFLGYDEPFSAEECGWIACR